ncbi:MAG: bifunctional phosphoglucose/phosphomannose isomerase [candidate division WOR-3 bacterium]
MSQFFDLIYKLPEQIEDAYNIARETNINFNKSKIHNIVVAGMGGSAIGGDILYSLTYDYLPVPITIVKDYKMPKFINSSTLVFVVSYSGNTEETLTCLLTAKKKNCAIIGVTNGGQVLTYCQKHNINYIQLPKGLPSRAALGYLFIPLLVALYKIGLIPKKEVEINESIKVLINNRRDYQRQMQILAKQLVKRLPLIYATSTLFTAVAKRWQAQFNENAKVLAHYNYFPELNHNEIVAITDNKAFVPIYNLILIDPKSHPRNLLRVKLTLQLIREKLSKQVRERFFYYKEILPDGKSDLARVFSLIMQGDLLTYYLALQRKIEPSLILPIDEFKEKLNNC